MHGAHQNRWHAEESAPSKNNRLAKLKITSDGGDDGNHCTWNVSATNIHTHNRKLSSGARAIGQMATRNIYILRNN